MLFCGDQLVFPGANAQGSGCFNGVNAVAAFDPLNEMGFAREVGNRIVFMDEGRIMEEGTPEQIARDPESVTGPFLKEVLDM